MKVEDMMNPSMTLTLSVTHTESMEVIDSVVLVIMCGLEERGEKIRSL